MLKEERETLRVGERLIVISRSDVLLEATGRVRTIKAAPPFGASHAWIVEVTGDGEVSVLADGAELVTIVCRHCGLAVTVEGGAGSLISGRRMPSSDFLISSCKTFQRSTSK